MPNLFLVLVIIRQPKYWNPSRDRSLIAFAEKIERVVQWPTGSATFSTVSFTTSVLCQRCHGAQAVADAAFLDGGDRVRESTCDDCRSF